MEKEIIDLCLKLGQQPSAQIILPVNCEEGVAFYHFEGRSFADFHGFAGMCCLHNPAFDLSVMYFSLAADFSRPGIPPRIRRLAKLLGYKAYIAPVQYEIPEEEKGGWMEDPEEDIQDQFRHCLLLDLYRCNEVLFMHPAADW